MFETVQVMFENFQYLKYQELFITCNTTLTVVNTASVLSETILLLSLAAFDPLNSLLPCDTQPN